MFLPSFGCNALLIQESDSICARGKYVCLAPAVIPKPGRTKQHTPHIYFSDAQKEQDCNPDQNSCSLRVRKHQAVISVTLGTSEIASPKAVLFQLSGITKSRLGTRLWHLLESFASLRGGTLCKSINQGVL